MRKRIYIETSIPSFYFEARSEPAMAARREWTRANANKFGHIRRVNAMLGVFVPALVTPLELLGDDDEDRG